MPQLRGSEPVLGLNTMYLIKCLLRKWQGNIISGCIFSTRNKKKQFIPLPWKIGDFLLRNINKIDEFVNHFHNVNLNYVENIKGFDPNKNCVEHML
jgi:hypothetical protein